MAINEQVLMILENFLGGIIDPDESRLSMMGSDIITADMLPKELRLQKEVFRGIENCDEKGMPPSIENIILLSLSKDNKMPEYLEKLAALEGTRSMVRANAIWLKDYLQQDLLTKAVDEISKLSKVDYGNTNEKRGMMLDKLLEVPLTEGAQSFTRLELIDLLEDEQRKRVERKEKGQTLGPIFHLAALREAAPILTEGDVSLITAPPKAGKTTTGMMIAQLNAYENDCDVLWLLLETSAKTIEERFLAQELLIPSKRLRDGTIDLRKEPFRSLHARYKEQQNDIWSNKGRIYLQYVAGQPLGAIAAQIRVHKRMADIRNRPLLVIIDYLQRIPKPGGKDETQGLAIIANSIKDMAHNFQCHIMLFSQESFSAEGKQRGDSRAHGSNTPIFVSQFHVSLRVLNSMVSVMMSDGSGNVLRDACGGERYWQFEGKFKRQAVVRYDLLRANDNETTQAYCAIESSLFQLADLSKSGMRIPEFMQDQIDHFSEDMNASPRQLI